jgi:hypothetical protein
MAAKLTRVIHKVVIQLHLVAESLLQAASPETFGYTLIHDWGGGGGKKKKKFVIKKTNLPVI